MHVSKAFEFDLDQEFPHLPSAPIVEAVIHWVARTERAVVRDEFRKLLTGRLPDYPECTPQQELRMEAQFGVDGSSSTQIRHDSWRGFRLTSDDRLWIAQFGRDGLIVSRLKPYPDWQAFSAEALRLWKIYSELLQPSDIQRLGVRFINRMPIAEPTDIRKFLSKAPQGLERLALPMNTFLYQSTHDVPGHPFGINVIQTIQPPTPPQTEASGLVLDIDVFTTQSFPVDDEDLDDRLSKMRWLKDKAFFGLLKKRAIKSFKRDVQ